MITGKIKTLYSDMEKTEALFPRTKVSAISDENGVGLDVLLENIAGGGENAGYIDANTLGGQLPEYYENEVKIDLDVSNVGEANPINADTLGGHNADEFAMASSVSNQIDTAIEELRQEILGGAW